MLKQVMDFENDYGCVVIFKETVGFSVKYSFRKCPGVYRCRVNNTPDYAGAMKHFNRYRGILKRRECISHLHGK